MSHSKERVAAILQALTANLPNILERATQIAIRDSLPTQLLVQELESHGYQLDATLDCTFLAIPLELIFERSLTDEDRAFLRLVDHSEENSAGISPAPGRNDLRLMTIENSAALCSNCRRPTNNHRPWCATYKTESEVSKAGDIVDHPVFGPTKLVSVYSRQEAIEDGVLVDCTQDFFDGLNRSAGLIFDVAMTQAVFERYVEVPKSFEGVQDQKGRYRDILLKFRAAVRTNPDCQELLFEITSVPNGSDCWTNERVATFPEQRVAELKAVAGPGDRGEPCLTFMLPWED